MASMATCFTLPSNPSHRLIPKPSILPYPRSQTLPILQTRHFPSFTYKVPQPRVSAAVVRAGIATAIRPGGAVESENLPSDVRKRAMEAVDACGRRVTVGDVAGRAGLKLTEAQNALQALASDTHGFLEVSDEGDVLYVFPKDYRARLVGKSFIMRVEPMLEKAKDGAEYLVRVSFGTALIVSIILVSTAIVVALLSASSSDKKSDSSDDDDRKKSGGGISYCSSSRSSTRISFSSCRDDVFWYWDRNYYRKRQKKDDGELKYGESFFSFVFGDGDPNPGIEQKRWRMIGHYISSNGGVVAAEELAPYLDIETSGETLTHEAYILPVLSRYEGQPLIDEEGNILYQFPSLQRTADKRTRTRFDGEPGKFLKEEKWQFSKTSIGERAMVIGLGVFNLCGVIILRDLLMDPTVAKDAFLKFITSIFPLLQIYAGSFFLIPLLRWFVLLKINADIEKRNQARQQFARDIEYPDLSLRQKLLSARNMAKRTVIGQDKIVYSSGKDLVEQEFDGGFQHIDKSDKRKSTITCD